VYALGYQYYNVFLYEIKLYNITIYRYLYIIVVDNKHTCYDITN